MGGAEEGLNKSRNKEQYFKVTCLERQGQGDNNRKIT